MSNVCILLPYNVVFTIKQTNINCNNDIVNGYNNILAPENINYIVRIFYYILVHSHILTHNHSIVSRQSYIS